MPCHNRIRGATIRPDIALANMVTTNVIRSNIKHIVAICIPTSMFHGTIRRPSPNKPSKIKQKANTNLNSLTTRKQINKDARIIARYVITNVFYFRIGA